MTRMSVLTDTNPIIIAQRQASGGSEVLNLEQPPTLNDGDEEGQIAIDASNNDAYVITERFDLFGSDASRWEKITKKVGVTDLEINIRAGEQVTIPSDGTEVLHIERPYKGWQKVTATSGYDTNTVIASNRFNNDYFAHHAFDPTRLMSGSWTNNSWITAQGSPRFARLNINIGTAKAVSRIGIVNGHHIGTNTEFGAGDFTVYGTNELYAFNNNIHGSSYGDLTELYSSALRQSAQTASDPAFNGEDEQFFEFANDVAYMYYIFEFTQSFANASYIAIRHINLYERTTDIFETVLPPTISGKHVRESGSYQTGYEAWNLLDNSKSSLGAASPPNRVWLVNGVTGQRFNIDMGVPVFVNEFLFENYFHVSNGTAVTNTGRGVNSLNIFGSDDPLDFYDTSTAGNSQLSQIIGVSIPQHLADNRSSWQKHEILMATSYRYYVFKINSNYGATMTGLRGLKMHRNRVVAPALLRRDVDYRITNTGVSLIVTAMTDLIGCTVKYLSK